MSSELEKLFYEVLEEYRKAQSEIHNKLLDVGLNSYQTAEKGLKNNIEEYKRRFRAIIENKKED